MVRVQRINNSIVEPVPVIRTEEDLKPVKGSDLLPEIYSNLYAVAMKKQGKSTLVYNIVKETSDPRTKIFAFVSTLNKDDTYDALQKYCELKHIEWNGFTSIIGEDGTNILQELIKGLQAELPDPKDKKTKKKRSVIQCDGDDCEDDCNKKKKKFKYIVHILTGTQR